jgi:hypothetical protein
MFEFSEKSKERLSSCDDRLQDIFNEVIKHYNCTIVCGYRDKDTQNELFDRGRSKLKWPNSKHNHYLSKAVDVIPSATGWDNLNELYYLAGLALGIAVSKGIKIKWGGRYKNFFDGAHVELDED